MLDISDYILGLSKETQVSILKDMLREKKFLAFQQASKILLDAPLDKGGLESEIIMKINREYLISNDFNETDDNSDGEVDRRLVYMSDDMYLPIQYKGIVVKQPHYKGKGNHSVAQLEQICEQYEEYVHQQQVIKQNCMKHIVELKFGYEQR